MQSVTRVKKGSVAWRLGVRPGFTLLSINGQKVLDIVDYEYLTASSRLGLSFLRPNGGKLNICIKKNEAATLGLEFSSGLMSDVRTCKNHCLFCFIDQMPKSGRETLHFKDDDWRLSLIMGNYITLTNVDDAEFERILSRRVSPLYISVHATDPGTRVRMMRNKHAGLLYGRLKRLKEAGLKFHCQIVCCPTINDGETLLNTLNDLYALRPQACSAAVVPVGLTKHREGLFPLRCFTKDEARNTVSLVREFADRCKRECGSAFVFVSDEFILNAGLALPPYEYYEDFTQIENGVGLLRLFEHEFIQALDDRAIPDKRICFDAAGGVLAAPFFEELYGRLRPYRIEYTLHPIRNDFFGSSITVGGLITGGDLANQLKGRLRSSKLLLPNQMFREREDVFLDGMTLKELENALGVRAIRVRGDGGEWVRTIFSLAEEEV